MTTPLPIPGSYTQPPYMQKNVKRDSKPMYMQKKPVYMQKKQATKKANNTNATNIVSWTILVFILVLASPVIIPTFIILSPIIIPLFIFCNSTIYKAMRLYYEQEHRDNIRALAIDKKIKDYMRIHNVSRDEAENKLNMSIRCSPEILG